MRLDLPVVLSLVLLALCLQVDAGREYSSYPFFYHKTKQTKKRKEEGKRRRLSLKTITLCLRFFFLLKEYKTKY